MDVDNPLCLDSFLVDYRALIPRNVLEPFQDVSLSEHLLMLEVAESDEIKFIRSLNVNCAVLEPGRRVAAISEDAKAKAIPFFCLNFAKGELRNECFTCPSRFI